MRSPGGKYGRCLESQVDRTWLWIGYVAWREEEGQGGSGTMCLFFLWCLIACPPELGGNLLTLKVRILKHWTIFILFYVLLRKFWASRAVLVVKNMPTTAGDERDMGLNPGSGRSPGVESGNPLQYSCLENFLPGKLQSMGPQRVGPDWAQGKS